MTKAGLKNRVCVDIDEALDDAIAFANVGIYRYNSEGKVAFMNQGCLKLLDLEDRYPDPKALVGKDIGSLFEYLSVPGSLREAVKSDGFVKNMEYQYRTLSGEERWVYHNSYVVEDPKTREELIQVIARDITNIKKTTLALEQSERRYRALAEQSLQGICLLDTEKMEILFANPAMAKIAGMKVEELVGLKSDSIWAGIHRDDLEETKKHIEDGASGRKKAGLYEFRVIRPDKSLCWVSTIYAPIQFEGQPAYQITLTDITERKEKEERRRAEEQRQFHAQKLESIGVLAGGIAHDFNNLLAGILGNADLAEVRIGDDEAVRAHLGSVRIATEQAAKLCQQLLAYAGKGQVSIESIQLGQMIAESLPLLEMSVAKKTNLVLDLEDGQDLIQGDPSQIRQILMNVVINASEAIDHRDGHIRIGTRTEVLSQGQLERMHHGKPLSEGRYVVLEISDNGQGMSEETMKQLFDPFFTTKFTGRGLGLASVIGILRSHNGAVGIESQPGKGTNFTIVFPVDERQKSKDRQWELPEVGWSGDGVVLVADDDPLVLKATVGIMRVLGFEVVTAKNGHDALEAFDTHRNKIKFVLLDVTMPGLSGLEVCKEIRERSADVPILISSGYNVKDLAAQVRDSGGTGFIAKPYHMPELVRLLASLF